MGIIRWPRGGRGQAVRALGVLVLGAALGGAFLLGRATAQTAAPEPGSWEDPLVTKAYVERLTLYQVVTIPKNQKLIAEAGAEIILRSGKATVIAGQGGGLANITAGRDLAKGEVVKANNLLIVPRSDGRGLKADATTDVIVLIRGLYKVGP